MRPRPADLLRRRAVALRSIRSPASLRWSWCATSSPGASSASPGQAPPDLAPELQSEPALQAHPGIPGGRLPVPDAPSRCHLAASLSTCRQHRCALMNPASLAPVLSTRPDQQEPVMAVQASYSSLSWKCCKVCTELVTPKNVAMIFDCACMPTTAQGSSHLEPQDAPDMLEEATAQGSANWVASAGVTCTRRR